MKTDYAGIDYSLGKANKDTSTGIHYGVIPLRALCEFANEEFDPFYGEEAEELPDYAEPIAWTLNKEGYQAEHGEDCDIFITKSPYFTYAQFCSPCAPGACYLLNPCDSGPRAYCFGHDWFQTGIAPYPVYSVETGELVEAKQKEN